PLGLASVSLWGVHGIRLGLLSLRRELFVAWLRRHHHVAALALIGTAGDNRWHDDVRHLHRLVFCPDGTFDRAAVESKANGRYEPAAGGTDIKIEDEESGLIHLPGRLLEREGCGGKFSTCGVGSAS